LRGETELQFSKQQGRCDSFNYIKLFTVTKLLTDLYLLFSPNVDLFGFFLNYIFFTTTECTMHSIDNNNCLIIIIILTYSLYELHYSMSYS